MVKDAPPERPSPPLEIYEAEGLLPKPLNGHEHLPKDWLPADDAPYLFQGKEGTLRPLYANAVMMLRREGHFFKLSYDEFSARPFLGDEPMSDGDLRTLHEWLQHRGVFVGKEISDQAVMRVAELHRFHQVRDWLEGLKWDGVNRIDHLMIDHAGVEDCDIHRVMTSKWIIQAVARVYEPGCQADSTLVLEGPQGKGKSSLFRALFGDKWFTDQLPDLKDKDASIQLQGVWCVEIAELARIRGKSMDHVKQFLTRRVDRFRTPYGKIADGHPRQTVFAGTVNPETNGYLHDPTGARRFWPMAVSEDINVQAFYDNREMIWAEAVHRYKANEPWYINNTVMAEQAAAIQADRFEADPWLESIAAYVRHKDKATLADIFADVLSINSMADRGQGEMNRIAKCLAHLGWERKRLTVKETKERKWFYVRTVPVLTQGLGHWDESDEKQPPDG